MIILHFHLQQQSKYELFRFIYTSHHFIPFGRCKLNKMTSLPICGFIAQLVGHRTGIADVSGSNPVEPSLSFNSAIYIAYFELDRGVNKTLKLDRCVQSTIKLRFIGVYNQKSKSKGF